MIHDDEGVPGLSGLTTRGRPAGDPLAEDGAPVSLPIDLPQRVLLVENSRTFTSMLREAIEQRVELPVTVVSTLAEAARVLDEEDGWFLVLTRDDRAELRSRLHRR